MERGDGPLWVSKPAQRLKVACPARRSFQETGNAIGIVAASVMETKKTQPRRIRCVQPTINARSAALAFADPDDAEAMTTDIPGWIPSWR